MKSRNHNRRKIKIENKAIICLLISAILILVVGGIVTTKREKEDSLFAQQINAKMYKNKESEDTSQNSKKDETRTITVAQDGSGDYKTINDAVQSASENATINVKSGIYNENVRAWNKNVSIIGSDKQTCILKSQEGTYKNPPLEIGAGHVENMTIFAERTSEGILPEGEGSDGWTSYAIHIDTDNSANKELTFLNCDIVSDWNSAVGAGLRNNFTLKFEKCNITTTAKEKTLGALYFHESDSKEFMGKQYLVVTDCNLKSTNYPYSITPYSLGHRENELYMTFNNTQFLSSINNDKSKLVNIINKIEGEGWNGYSNFFLTKESSGNNVEAFNYKSN